MALEDKQNKEKNNRTIVLPFTQSEYDRFMADLPFAHQKVRHHFQTPRTFPTRDGTRLRFYGTTRVS